MGINCPGPSEEGAAKGDASSYWPEPAIPETLHGVSGPAGSSEGQVVLFKQMFDKDLTANALWEICCGRLVTPTWERWTFEGLGLNLGDEGRNQRYQASPLQWMT